MIRTILVIIGVANMAIGLTTALLTLVGIASEGTHARMVTAALPLLLVGVGVLCLDRGRAPGDA